MLTDKQKFDILSKIDELNIIKYYNDKKKVEGVNVDEFNLNLSKKCYEKFENFLSKNYEKIELLEKDWYITIFCNWEWWKCLQSYKSSFNTKDYFPIITSKWKLFLENYDNSKSKKLDTYLWKYPNISKLFYTLFWIILWIIWTMITKILLLKFTK